MLVHRWSNIVDGGPNLNQHDSMYCVCWAAYNLNFDLNCINMVLVYYDSQVL